MRGYTFIYAISFTLLIYNNWYFMLYVLHLLPTGSEERGVLGAGSIPGVILHSGQGRKNYCIMIV